MKIFTEAAGDLLVKCIDRASEIYGKNLPMRINKRVVDEVAMLNDIGLEEDFYELSVMMDNAAPERADRINVGLRGGAASLLVSYLCGLSPFNPVEYMDAKFYPEIYHDTVIEEKRAGIEPRVTINVGRGLYDKLKQMTTIFPRHTVICPTENLILLEKLQDKTGKIFFPSDKASTGAEDLDNVRKALWKAEERGLCFWDHVPLLKENMIIRKLTYVKYMNSISNLSKIIGVAMGTGTWIDNSEKIFDAQTIYGTVFDIGSPYIISCIEDVYDSLISENQWKDNDIALRIALHTRTGSCNREDLDYLHLNCDKLVISSIEKVRYLMDRPACVTSAIEAKRLAYYWNLSILNYLQVEREE